MTTEVKLPNLGDGIAAGDVVKLLVKVGDAVTVEQTILELETDKAVVPLPSPAAGKVAKILVKEGQKVPVGGVILTLEGSNGAATAPAATAPAKPVAAATPAPVPTPTPAPAVVEKAAPVPTHLAPVQAAAVVQVVAVSTNVQAGGAGRPPAPASPAVRKMARKLGVDLYRVKGSGPGGRIKQEDLEAHVKETLTAVQEGGGMAGAAGPGKAPPLPDFAQWGPIERSPVKGIRKATAEAMSLAWHMAPRVTQFDKADITEVEAGRKRYEAARTKSSSKGQAGGKLTITVLAMKAVVAALKAFPQVNSSFDPNAQELIYKKYYHIGVAVDTEHGLVVPVIRNVDQKSARELALELEAVAEKARARKLSIDDMRGGCFTISNLGGVGGTNFTPIVNYPEVAILGIARASKEIVVGEDDDISKAQVRLMCPLALSYDHRVVDGADGARFLSKVARLLSDPVTLAVEI